jgi:hypothetical protein
VPQATAEQPTADELEINRAFGVATRQGVEHHGTSSIFHTVDRPGARRAELLDSRNTQIDWRPSPSPRKSADEEQFDRAFTHRTAAASNTMVKREGSSLTFDAAGAARAARERFARLHG